MTSLQIKSEFKEAPGSGQVNFHKRLGSGNEALLPHQPALLSLMHSHAANIIVAMQP